jgi:acyl carrier protein
VLSERPSAAEIRRAVHRAITDVLERAGRPAPPFDDADELIATGLTSLDLAALVARLEHRWHLDPFLESRSITEMRTVGDLCRAYQECLQSG